MAGRPLRLATGIDVWCEHSELSGDVPIVLLHAWGESSRAFDRLRTYLPAEIPVTAYDQRGHGKSQKPTRGYEMSAFVHDCVAVLDGLGIERALLAGSSSGGYVAQQVAVDMPDRVAGLVAVGAPRSLRGYGPFRQELEDLSDPVDPEWMRRWIGEFELVQAVPAWYLAERVEDALKCTAASFIGTFDGLVEAIPPTEAGSITAPTTIVWGENDQLLPAEDADRLHTAISGSRLVRLAGTGHLVLWERPREVARELESLWRQIRVTVGGL